MHQIGTYLFLLLLIPLANNAQNHPFLERFQAVEVEGMVYLTWTVKAGNTCNGVSVLRSTGASAFAAIGDIPGVCGSVSEDVDYAFTDSFPMPNTLNSYRLELGNEGLSQIVSIRITGLGQDGYQVRPQPVFGRSEVLFKNDKRQRLTLQIINMNGQLFWESQTEEDRFTIDRADFPAGLYLFTIRDTNGQLRNTGKIVVAP